MVIAPPLPPVAEPLAMLIVPLSPLLVVPDANARLPLTPLAPALADRAPTSPLDVAEPLPLEMHSEPPDDPAPVPAVTQMAPPPPCDAPLPVPPTISTTPPAATASVLSPADTSMAIEVAVALCQLSCVLLSWAFLRGALPAARHSLEPPPRGHESHGKTEEPGGGRRRRGKGAPRLA